MQFTLRIPAKIRHKFGKDFADVDAIIFETKQINQKAWGYFEAKIEGVQFRKPSEVFDVKSLAPKEFEAVVFAPKQNAISLIVEKTLPQKLKEGTKVLVSIRIV